MDIHSFNQTYLQVEQINKGGTGTIYRAYHRNLGKYVVLKNIELSGNDEIKRREVDILKNLRHRYLPAIYDFIEVGGKEYIVEDYIRGTDLNAYLKNRVRVPQDQIIKWMRQLCEVLEYLHTRKPTIIHSDIKPGNIMIDEQGDVCLIDFNISILHDSNAVVLGYSNFYCSPEQMAQANAIRGGYGASAVKVDSRSDIYSLGATFYAVLSGIVPVCGARNVPLSKMNIPYTEGFLCLIDKCMEISPSKRFQSARQVASMLNRTEMLTERYKKYTLMRNILSIAGTVIFVIGIVTLAFGERSRIVTAYENDYKSISEAFKQNGISKELSDAAQDILSEDEYESILEKNPVDKAKLYAIEGEYNFSLENSGGYHNAMQFYEKALNTVLKVDGAEDYVQKYALNYITSAALAGYKDAAEAAVIKYFGAGNTLLSDAVNAELAYSNGNFDSVLTYAEAVKSSLQSSYRDVRKNVYKIAALVCGKKGDTAGVVKWYAEIDRTEPTDESRSDLVSAYIDLGISSENDREAQNSFLKALDIYNSIIAKTPADKINYAQILYGMKKYSESLKVLESITVKDTVLICKKSYVLALVHYELNYKQPNTESLKYCHEAVSYYNMLPGDQKKEIPVSSLESLMQVLGMRLEIKK